MKKNYVSFVVDASGSMYPYTAKMRELLTSMTNSVIANSAGQDTKVRYEFFGSRLENRHDFQTYNPLKYPSTDFTKTPVVPEYNPTGNTALNDAIMRTIEKHQRYKPSLLGDVAHLIIILTDGEENDSDTSSTVVAEAIRKAQTTGVYTFAFNAPPRHKNVIARLYEIPAENIREWEQSNTGFAETQRINDIGTQTYFTSRKLGSTASTSYYVTDLSSISSKDLNDCDDFTKRLRSYVVPRECRIDEFVNNVAPPFIRGAAFYQLTKPEKIQQHKQLVIRPKGTQRYYGGNHVKELLGIPLFKDVKVEPGNHANYDLFVQSTSDNRKLVRGSHVLVVK